MKAIAEAHGRGLKVPVVSIKPEDAETHFGWLANFAKVDVPSSSVIARQKLNWKPTAGTDRRPGQHGLLPGLSFVLRAPAAAKRLYLSAFGSSPLESVAGPGRESRVLGSVVESGFRVSA